MSADFSIKPVGAPVAPLIVQPVSDAAEDAVATELPASQSVTAAGAGAGVPVAANTNLSYQAFVDTAAGSIVYQTVNENTGSVVSQFPDAATLRRRAYFRALDLAKESSPGGVATDRSA
jgi:hypothetical protein